MEINNTEKEFLENFYKNMNSSIADYEKDNTDDVFYYSFSEIKEKQFMSEESRRNHEIINSHEVFNEEYIYKNFKLVRVDNSNHAIGFSRFVFEDDEEYNNVEENNFNLQRMVEAIESESFKLPSGLSIEEKRQYILSNEDIKLKDIDDNDKIEVIKSLLDNK